MYREATSENYGYGPEYLENEQYYEDYGDESYYDDDEGYEMSEAVAGEIHEWAEAISEMTEGMNEAELAEFAEELLEDEFWGSILRVAAPIAGGLAKKYGKRALKAVIRRGPKVARKAWRHGKRIYRKTAPYLRPVANYGRQQLCRKMCQR